jgi:nicotinamidase-related amidase
MSSALLIIDVQRDYFPGGGYPLPNMESASKTASKLLSHFRKQGAIIAHIWHVEKDPSATFFIPGSEGTEIHPIVAPKKSELLVEKNYPNSFRSTNLSADLSSLGINNLIICGAMSNMCIDATVRAAFDLGFECTVISDACAASDIKFRERTIPAPDVHGSFMGALAAGYANVVTLDEYLTSDVK